MNSPHIIILISLFLSSSIIRCTTKPAPHHCSHNEINLISATCHTTTATTTKKPIEIHNYPKCCQNLLLYAVWSSLPIALHSIRRLKSCALVLFPLRPPQLSPFPICNAWKLNKPDAPPIFPTEHGSGVRLHGSSPRPAGDHCTDPCTDLCSEGLP